MLVELGVVEQRHAAVLEVFSGVAVTLVAARYGVSRQTVRREFLAGRRFASIGEAQAALDAWVATYNEERPHQGIAMAPTRELSGEQRRCPAAVGDGATRYWGLTCVASFFLS
jgi:hypothetical protein